MPAERSRLDMFSEFSLSILIVVLEFPSLSVIFLIFEPNKLRLAPTESCLRMKYSIPRSNVNPKPFPVNK